MQTRANQIFDVAMEDLDHDDEYVARALDSINGGGPELALVPVIACLDNMETKTKFWWEDEARQIVAEYIKPRR